MKDAAQEPGVPEYDPQEWNSKQEYLDHVALIKLRAEERRIFNEAIDADPTINIHVWRTVVHPGHEQRTAWLRPGNAFTECMFRMLEMSGQPPHEILETEQRLGINQEPYMISALVIYGPRPDDADFPEYIIHVIQSEFAPQDKEQITVIVHDEVVALDRGLERNAYGAE